MRSKKEIDGVRKESRSKKEIDGGRKETGSKKEIDGGRKETRSEKENHLGGKKVRKKEFGQKFVFSKGSLIKTIPFFALVFSSQCFCTQDWFA